MRRLIASLFLLLVAIASRASSLEVTLECKIRKNECSNSAIKITEQNVTLKEVKDKDITTLKIHSTKTNYMPVNLAATFPLLTALRVYSAEVKEIKKTDFDGLGKLTELKLSNNLLTKLSSDAFEALANLEKIDLEHNQLQYLPSRVFSPNPKLKEIVVSHNKLNILNDATFKKLTNLRSLFIDHNEIGEFQSGTFSDCRELNVLDFSNNKLMHVPEDIFDGLEMKFGRKYFKDNDCIKSYEANEDTEVASYDELKAAFQETCKPSNQEKIDELNSKIKELEAENEELTKNVKKLEKEVESTSKELTAAEDEKNKCINELNEKNAIESLLNDSKKKLQTTVNNQTHENKNLKSSNAEMSDRIKHLTDTLDTLNKTHINLNTNHELIKSGSYLCTISSAKLQKSLDAQNEKVEKLERELARLEGVDRELNECKQNTTENTVTFDFFKTLALHARSENCGTTSTSKPLIASATPRPAITHTTITIPVTFENSKVNPKDQSSHYTCTIAHFASSNDDQSVRYEITGSHQPAHVDSSVRFLNIIHTNNSILPSVIFDKFTALKFMKVDESHFNTFDYKCGGIEVIFIRKSTVGETFDISACPALQKLTISFANVKTIKPPTQQLPTLTEIILRGNQIEELSVDLFRNFEKLHTVDVSRNKITRVDGRIFDANVNLDTVIFTDNKIVKIDGEIFTKNGKLRMIVFKNCGCVDKTGFGEAMMKATKAKINEKCK